MLKENQTVKLSNGKRGKVIRFLGEGAQGAVYLIDQEGETKALKYYKRMPDVQFMDNLRKNIDNGAPSPIFLWPEATTRMIGDSVGYTMPLKPTDSEEFSKFRLGRERFRSMAAVINASVNLCLAFKSIHAHGLSFQDFNDGGFFVNPVTGDLKICDCDNVAPHGECSGILGKARYMAPEIVRGDSLPDSYTDRFSMALIIFMFFCVDHPFEGLNVVRNPCMTEEIERRLYGKDLTFIFDPTDSRNRPVRGVHRNVLTIWPLLPKSLRNLFISEFSRDKFENPQSRATESEWLNVLCEIRDYLQKCPACGDEIFADGECKCLNRTCGSIHSPQVVLNSGRRNIAVAAGKLIYLSKDNDLDGRIIAKPDDKTCLLLQNLSANTWKIKTPAGKLIDVKPRGLCPAKTGLELSTTKNENQIKFKIKNL